MQQNSVCVEQMFNFAIERDAIEISPAYGIKKRGIERKTRTNFSNSEIKQFWGALKASTTSMLLKFLLLTGQRTGEARQVEWSEIDGDLWHIPASKSKNKVPM